MQKYLAAALLCAWTSVQGAPAIQHWTTPNGARVLFVSATEPPLVDVRLVFDAGAARDGARGGLARLTAGLLFDGTGELDADALARGFEDIGAQYGAAAQRDMATVSLRTLAQPGILERAAGLLARAMGQPAFPTTAVSREGRALEVMLGQQQQDPGQIASRAFYAALYGAHPYAGWPEGTVASVRALDRRAVAEFHQRHYVASNAVVVIVGALERPRAEALAQQLTALLPVGEAPPALPAVTAPPPLIQDIPYASAQTHVLLGLPLLTRTDPDYFPVLVGNHALGGNGLIGRVSVEIREKRGLAYSAYSTVAAMRAAGPLVLGLQTKSAQADAATALLRQVLEDFVRDGPTAAELDAAKRQLADSFPLNVDSNKEIADYLTMIGFYGLPLDYLDRLQERVRAVTAQQVRDAYQRRVHPSALVQVRVGGSPPAASAPQGAALAPGVPENSATPTSPGSPGKASAAP